MTRLPEEEASSKIDLSHSAKPTSSEIDVQAVAYSQMWIGPLPPPHILAEYNQAFPGCAERMVKMAETQSAHRQHLERITVEGNQRSQTRGQYMAFLLALVILVAGFVLIFLNKHILGTIFVCSDITALVGLFIYGKHDQRSQLRKKEKMMRTSKSADKEQ